MLWIFEVIVVMLAFVALVISGMDAGRRAMAMGRSGRWMARRALERVEGLLTGADAAQRHVSSITEKQGLLLRRVFVLQRTAQKLLVLIKAYREARSRLNPILRYIGH